MPVERAKLVANERTQLTSHPLAGIEEYEQLMSNTDVVRAAFDAYLAQDRDAAERLIAEDYSFTSPQDDHIDKAAFLERCFPTTDRLTSQGRAGWLRTG